MNHKLFETRLANLQSQYQFTLTDIYRRTGLSYQYISNLKTGKTQSPSYDKLSKLARLFGVSVQYLVGDED